MINRIVQVLLGICFMEGGKRMERKSMEVEVEGFDKKKLEQKLSKAIINIIKSRISSKTVFENKDTECK